MSRITDIKPQKRQKRVNIFLDGQFAFGLDLETLTKTGLQIGQEISQEKIEEIIKEGELAKVYNRILKFLSFRPRSEKEILLWFKRKEVGSETKRLIFKKLKKQGLVDDELFAKWWIEQRIAFRPQGLKAIRLELYQKGIERKLIDRLFEETDLGSSEEKMAQKAALKKMKSLNNFSLREKRKKLIGFLQRRGFSWEVARKVFDDLLPPK